MKIGFGELLVVFVVALFVIGPDKLPQFARRIGQALSEFRSAADGMTQELREQVIVPLNEAQQPIRDAVAPVKAVQDSVNGDIQKIQKEMNEIGKVPPESMAAVEEKDENRNAGTDDCTGDRDDFVRTDTAPSTF